MVNTTESDVSNEELKEWSKPELKKMDVSAETASGLPGTTDAPFTTS